MTAKKFAAFALMLLLLIPALTPAVYAAGNTTGDAVITFYKVPPGTGPGEGPPPSGGNNGGNGSGGGLTGKPANRDKTYITDAKIPENVVSIIKPEVPLADLGDLPKTGGSDLFPVLLISAGMLLLAAYGATGKHSLA